VGLRVRYLFGSPSPEALFRSTSGAGRRKRHHVRILFGPTDPPSSAPTWVVMSDRDTRRRRSRVPKK
jgi:hypothetical protein